MESPAGKLIEIRRCLIHTQTVSIYVVGRVKVNNFKSAGQLER